MADATTSSAGIAALMIVAALATEIPPALAPVAFTLAAAALWPVAQLSDLLRNLGSLRAAGRRIVEVFDRRPSVQEPSRSVHVPAASQGGLELRDVRFRYRPDGPDVLSEVSFTVAPGETVALVGPSGAGKSTCAALALRWWDPDAGAVLVGGVSLRDLTDSDLRTRVSAVPQGLDLLSGTIASNIRLGHPAATPREVERAAAAAGILSPGAGLPLALATPVGERGSGLSGGQRARVAIARALLVDPEVLVLDEATAGLDSEADAAIAELLAIPSTRATLVIAHRPATISRCDRVLQLLEGRLL